MGILCGIAVLVLLLLGSPHFRNIVPQIALVVVMLALTAYSQFSIIPRMDTARDSVGGNIEAVAADNPGRQIFDRLHVLSVRVEGVVLLCGIAALRGHGASCPARTVMEAFSGIAYCTDRHGSRTKDRLMGLFLFPD